VLITARGSWEKTVPRGHLAMPYTTVRASLGSDGSKCLLPLTYPSRNILSICLCLVLHNFIFCHSIMFRCIAAVYASLRCIVFWSATSTIPSSLITLVFILGTVAVAPTVFNCVLCTGCYVPACFSQRCYEGYVPLVF
jgi:hypothetical protein